MRKTIFLLIITFITATSLYAQQLRKVKNEAFKRGEKLKYNAYYTAPVIPNLSVGIAVCSIKKEHKQFKSRDTYHIEATGRTKTFYNWFFKVSDKYETFLDEEAMVPWLFMRKVHEGSYKKSRDVFFDQFRNIAVTSTATVKVPENIHDIISAFYYARTIDFSNYKIGEEIPINFLFDDSVFTTKIIYLGKEIIKTDLGKFRCLKMKPKVLTGSVFSEPFPMTFWVSDDKNHIPIMLETKILVGSVRLELLKYSNLANPVTSKIE
jgi:hypothetical protein